VISSIRPSRGSAPSAKAVKAGRRTDKPGKTALASRKRQADRTIGLKSKKASRQVLSSSSRTKNRIKATGRAAMSQKRKAGAVTKAVKQKQQKDEVSLKTVHGAKPRS